MTSTSHLRIPRSRQVGALPILTSSPCKTHVKAKAGIRTQDQMILVRALYSTHADSLMGREGLFFYHRYHTDSPYPRKEITRKPGNSELRVP